MRAVLIALWGLFLGGASIFSPTPADASVRVVPFSKAGPWSVRAVFRAEGTFDHCSANATYKSGTRVSIIAYQTGNWRLWFAHNSWPDRGNQQFAATIQVDGRTVYQGAGHFKNRNAYVNLGNSAERVGALMRGRAMSIITPAGTSRFSLDGTYRASLDVARCWTANVRRPSAGGAFGGGGSGAFGGGTGGAFGGGGGAAPTPGAATVMSRAQTLEFATLYLGKSPQPYTILPQHQNKLKRFPVNWTYRSGGIGGMKVYRNATAPVDSILAALLSDQAKACDGRNASQRETPAQVRGRRVARARGVCETASGNVLNITYRVADLGSNMVMMIMEIQSGKARDAAPAPARPGPGNPGNGGASPPSSPPGNAPGGVYVPGPNEL